MISFIAKCFVDIETLAAGTVGTASSSLSRNPDLTNVSAGTSTSLPILPKPEALTKIANCIQAANKRRSFLSERLKDEPKSGVRCDVLG